MAEKESFPLKESISEQDAQQDSASDNDYSDDYAAFMLDMLPETPADIVELPHVATTTSDVPVPSEETVSDNTDSALDNNVTADESYLRTEDNIATTTVEIDTDMVEHSDTFKGQSGSVFSYVFPVAPVRGIQSRIAASARACAVDITPRYTRVCALAKSVGLSPASAKKYGKDGAPLLFSECEHSDVNTWDELSDDENTRVDALKTLVKHHKLNGFYTNIALPMSAAVLQTMPMANISTTELNDMITENENFWYPVLGDRKKPEDYAISYEVVLRDQTADMMYLNVAAYHKEKFDSFERIVEAAGLKVVSAEIRETALLRAFSQALGGDDICIGLLQIGPEENHFLLTYNGLVTAKEITINDWDKVALVNGDDQLLQSLTSRYAEEILNAMSLFQADCNAPPPSYVGLASYIPLAPVFIEALSGAVPEASFLTLTRDDEHRGAFTIADILPGGEQEKKLYNKPLAADACVIAMTGRHPVAATDGGLTPERLNMFPGKIAFARALIQRRIGMIAATSALIITLIAGGIGTAVVERTKGDISAGITLMKKDSAGYTDIINTAKSLKSFTDMLKEVGTLPSELPLNQEQVMSAMKRVHNTIPAGVWLDEFDFAYPDRISMSGRALQDREILDFMNQLSSGSVFASVTLKMMEAREEDGAVSDMTDSDGGTKQKRLVKSFRIDAGLPQPTRVTIE